MGAQADNGGCSLRLYGAIAGALQYGGLPI